jgi:hypothetical protein
MTVLSEQLSAPLVINLAEQLPPMSQRWLTKPFTHTHHNYALAMAL